MYYSSPGAKKHPTRISCFLSVADLFDPGEKDFVPGKKDKRGTQGSPHSPLGLEGDPVQLDRVLVVIVSTLRCVHTTTTNTIGVIMLSSVKGMFHGGHGYHAKECRCKRCALELQGRFIVYSFHSSQEAQSLAELGIWFRQCLESWMSRYATLQVVNRRSFSTKVELFGCLDSIRYIQGGYLVWVYRVLVALPWDMKWDRLWEKLLSRKGYPEQGLALEQRFARGDRIDANVWVRRPGMNKAEDFQLFYESVISWMMYEDSGALRSTGRFFGDLKAMNEQRDQMIKRLRRQS